MDGSSAVAERKNREDVDRQVAMLAKAYRNAGKAVEVALHVEDATRRNRYNVRLTVDGYEVTSWVHVQTVDLWLSLLDMRRAVEQLDRRDIPAQGLADSVSAVIATQGESLEDGETAILHAAFRVLERLAAR
jgi:hypothetical protein